MLRWCKVILVSVVLLANLAPAPGHAQVSDYAAIADNIKAALAIMERSGGWSTGMGCTLSSIPGTSAHDLSAALETVKASIWAYEVATRCGETMCASPEQNLIHQGLDAEFNQCISYGQLEHNLRRRLGR